MPHCLIIRAAGTNCDRELEHAFRVAGATTKSIHLNSLLENPELIENFDLIGIPGGFSYGDDLGAGRIVALLMRQRLYPALRRAIERGVPIFAPCNGFQILVKMGLLPGPNARAGEHWPAEEPPRQTTTLTGNAGGRFIDAWVGVEVNRNSPCIWTKNLNLSRESAILPIAHGEGRFVADDATLNALEENEQVALRYSGGPGLGNPNGSMRDIAGICDQTGLVFGLMPHPERFTDWTRHPNWTRLERSVIQEQVPLGLQMFRNAVEHAASVRV